MSYQQQQFTAIADKIREKTNTTDPIKPIDFESKIDEVYNTGYADGKQAEYDAFWDAYQENGNRETYNYAFIGWTDDCYNPKYPVSIISASASIGNAYNSTKITDTKVPIVASCQTLVTLFSNSPSLVSIPHLDLTNVTNLIDRCFNFCTNLSNLIMVGSIQANGFDVHWSKSLTHDSLMSIIEALSDKTGDTSGTEWVCTLGAENLEKLTEAEIAVATGKGWILA